MSKAFAEWYLNYKDSVIRALPWIKDYLQDAFNAGYKAGRRSKS